MRKGVGKDSVKKCFEMNVMVKKGLKVIRDKLSKINLGEKL